MILNYFNVKYDKQIDIQFKRLAKFDLQQQVALLY